MKSIVRRPYVYAVLILWVLYLGLAIVISGFYNTIPLVLRYASTVNWVELILSILFSIAIGALVALNSVSLYIKYKERQQCRKEGAIATVGTLGGLAAGICPLCVTGLFPLILGLFGVTFSFAALPFNGLEVQLASIILLSLSLWFMTRKPYFFKNSRHA